MKYFSSIAIIFPLAAVLTCQGQTLKGGWIEVHFLFYNVTDKVDYYYLTIQTYGQPSVAPILQYWDPVTGKEVLNQSILKNDTPVTYSYTNHFSNCPKNVSLNNPYSVGYKYTTFAAPPNANGYLVTVSYTGRDTTIRNIIDPVAAGMYLMASIPGSFNGIDYSKNNGPDLDFIDTVSTCPGTYFSYRVTGSDKDGDSLSYRFGEALNTAINPDFPGAYPVLYNAGFTAADPFGTGVSINPATGVVDGIAPAVPGNYLVAVYVQEWRKGVLFNTSIKESLVKVVNCPFAAPLLKPLYSSCRRYTFTFTNEPTCPDITSWLWDFGIPGAPSSNLPAPSFTYPAQPGTYTLKLKVANNNGYTDSATATVQIADSVQVKLPADTAICSKDTIVLKPLTNGLQFLWTESGGGNTLSNRAVKNPLAYPSASSTVYSLTASSDDCIASGQTIVYSAPYPKVDAGRDTVLCSGGTTVLNGSTNGAFFTWSPASSLINYNSLHPIARPTTATWYILTARDTSYCPKPASDSVRVEVVAPFSISAGPDKAVAVGYPFQLNVTTDDPASLLYVWQPASYLDNNITPTPNGLIKAPAPAEVLFTVKAYTPEGCMTSDEVLVKIYSTGPDIMVPNAFTPNHDGVNDVLKPVLIGIKTLEYFSIFNRFGKRVFYTTSQNEGWSGDTGGHPQESGAYVFITQGKDFNGKTINKKGSIVLIR